MSDEGVVQILTLLNEFKIEIRSEMAGIKQEIAGIKQEIAGIKQEITGIKQEITGIKQEISSMKQQINNLNKRIDKIEEQMRIDKEEIIQEYKESQELIGKMFAEQNLKNERLAKAIGIA